MKAIQIKPVTVSLIVNGPSNPEGSKGMAFMGMPLKSWLKTMLVLVSCNSLPISTRNGAIQSIPISKPNRFASSRAKTNSWFYASDPNKNCAGTSLLPR